MLEVHEEDEEDINPFTMLLAGEDEDGDPKRNTRLHASPGKPQLEQHYIRSVDAALVIRQLPSEGLSFQLWPAATTLVTLLDDHRRDPSKSPLSPILSASSDGPDRVPLSILELGSGTGLVGIAAAVTLGAIVTVTDLPHVIPNLQFNVDANSAALTANGGTVTVAPLRWGEAGDVELIGREFDVILASDVVYHDHLYEPLLQTLYLLLGGRETTSFVMAHLRRWKKDSAFFKKAKKAFNVEVLYEDSPSEGSRIGVVVYLFAGKKIRKSYVVSANKA
ncbi:Lysine methyltransferase [Trema orientale]|uniref:Lysine methyltransferase n=1 Tax=Trema orientale TaxID=63057 RepID=A0A2P5FXK3_TREOI|nr:Lysine methyltransferase [Trema orientale]